MARLVTFDEDAIKEILSSPEAMEIVAGVALELADDAKALTPIGKTGDHAEATKAFSPFINEDGIASCYFGSTSSTWHLLEYGTATNPAYRPLTAAAERSPLVVYTLVPK